MVRFYCRLAVSESPLCILSMAMSSVSGRLFLLDEPDDVKRLLSLQLTGAYVNECIETNINLLSDIAGRVGRYPATIRAYARGQGYGADTNAPILNTPWATFWLIHHPNGKCSTNPGTAYREFAEKPSAS